MKERDGLNVVDNGRNNVLIFSDSQKFVNSKISIVGDDNCIMLGDCPYYNGLNFNIKGNNKRFEVGSSSRTVVGLRFVSIRGSNQSVLIGKDFGCGSLEIQMNDGDENLVIGDDCLFSWGIKIRTSDGHSVIDLTNNRVLNWPSPVVIGDHVWIGEDVKILKGVSVPSNTVVGSGSILTTKFLKSNTVIAGVPAKVVKENINWDRRMPSEIENS